MDAPLNRVLTPVKAYLTPGCLWILVVALFSLLALLLGFITRTLIDATDIRSEPRTVFGQRAGA